MMMNDSFLKKSKHTGKKKFDDFKIIVRDES